MIAASVLSTLFSEPNLAPLLDQQHAQPERNDEQPHPDHQRRCAEQRVAPRDVDDKRQQLRTPSIVQRHDLALQQLPLHGGSTISGAPRVYPLPDFRQK
jgi:hypothetical protein